MTPVRRTMRGAKAFTLLEVILALAVFGIAAALLGELGRQGMRYAEAARDDTQAQLLCESVLSDILSGVKELASTSATPLQTDPNASSLEAADWQYSVGVTQAQQPNLLLVEVVVERAGESLGRRASCKLSRLVKDPNAASENELEEESSSSSGSSSSSTSSSSGGNSSGASSSSGGGG